MTHVLKVFGVTVAEAARLLGVSPSHIYRLIASDPTFPKLRKVGRASRLDPQELREWYDAQTIARKPRRPISMQPSVRVQHVVRHVQEVNQS